jgi:hypothetical protein
MPETLFSLASALQHAGNEQEAVIYYARIVTDHPLSDRVSPAKQELSLLKQPIPEPNPVALARAQESQHEEPAGVLGKLVAVLRGRPTVSTTTAAASNAAAEEATGDATGPVRGGTAAGSKSGSANDSPSFNIDPKVVQGSGSNGGALVTQKAPQANPDGSYTCWDSSKVAHANDCPPPKK